MSSRRWLAVAAAVALVLLGGRAAAGLYVDYRWHASLGDPVLAVWRARVVDLAAIRLVLGLAGAGFVFANLFGVSISVESLVLPRRLGDLEIGEKVPGERLLWLAGAIALIAGALLALLVDDWMSFDLAAFARAFGVPEPYTNADLGFFVFWLPFENALYLWAIAVLLAAAALAIVLYVLTAGLRWEAGRLRATRHVRRHLTALAAGLLLVLAWGHRLDGYALLWSGSGPDGAFTVVDDVIGLRSRFALAWITAVAAIVVLNAGWQGQPRLTFWTLSVVFVATLFLRALLPAFGTRIVGADDYARRNAPYLHNRAAVTQTAYAVNRVQRAPAAYGASDADALSGAASVWEPAALARAIERKRRGEIVADDLGWQPLADRIIAVAVTRPAPPPDAEPLSWNVVQAEGWRADPLGEPEFVDSVGTPASPASARERRLLTFPQASGYAIVSDSAGRLVADPVGNFWSRLAHAWDQRDLRLLASSAIGNVDRPAIVLRRSVRDRVAAVAPFFVQGRSITPLLAHDTLFWSCPLYAASNAFPLSQRYAVGTTTWGYYQHAATAVVNGESGAVFIVPTPRPDRVSEAWMRRFPALFAAGAALPPSLTALLPPPTDGVLLQAWALSQYGSRSDLTAGPLRLPGGDGGDSTLGIGARALSLLPLAGAGDRVPGWTLPLLDASDRVSGVLVALGGETPATLWLPNPVASARWTDVTERLRAALPAPTESPDARDVVRGRVLVFPVAGRLAFAEPAYNVRADGRSAVVGVAGLFGDTVRFGRTVADALGAASAPATRAFESRPRPTDGPRRLRALYDAMRAALRRGDWSAFGAAFDSLGAALPRAAR